jgi:hypothetical protein
LVRKGYGAAFGLRTRMECRRGLVHAAEAASNLALKGTPICSTAWPAERFLPSSDAIGAHSDLDRAARLYNGQWYPAATDRKSRLFPALAGPDQQLAEWPGFVFSY